MTTPDIKFTLVAEAFLWREVRWYSAWNMGSKETPSTSRKRKSTQQEVVPACRRRQNKVDNGVVADVTAFSRRHRAARATTSGEPRQHAGRESAAAVERRPNRIKQQMATMISGGASDPVCGGVGQATTIIAPVSARSAVFYPLRQLLASIAEQPHRVFFSGGPPQVPADYQKMRLSKLRRVAQQRRLP